MILSLVLCAAAWAQVGPAPRPPSGGSLSPVGPSTGPAATTPAGEEGGEVSGTGAGTSARNGRDDVNCDDFRFQEEAQDFFERQGGLRGGDEDKLDEDPGEDDGRACEDLPSRDEGGSAGGEDFDDDTPSGGVASGYGPPAPTRGATTTDGRPPFGLLVGGTLLALCLIAAAVTRRCERQ